MMMTIDQMIAELTRLRHIHGGDLQVGAWPDDGQLIYQHSFHKGFQLYQDCEVVVRIDRTARPNHITETRTFLMYEAPG